MAEEGEAAAAPPAAMVGEEDAGAAPAAEDFGLSAELMAVLPEDPFAQLDVARKITSIALASRLGRLEAEAARLRAQLAERNAEAEDLRERVEQLDAALAVATGRLRRAEEEKETLLSEKASLSNTVRKLNRDVAKLEVFKRTLMQSLQEDEDNPNAAPRARVTETSNFSSATSVTDDDSAFPAYKSSQFSETASSVSDESGHVDQDVPRPPRPQVFLPSYNSTPRITPSDSPPRRHSISVTSMNMFNDRSSVFSGHHSSPFDAASQTDIFGFGGTLHFGRRTNRKRTPGLYWFRPPMWALGKGIMPSREERKLEPPWMTDRLQAMIERVHHLRDKGLTTTNVVEIFIRWRLIPLCCRSSLAFTYSGFMDENMVSSAD